MKIIPAVLRIIKQQSSIVRMSILFALKNGPGEGMTLRDIQHSIENSLSGKEISKSTLSHLFSELEKTRLLQRIDRNTLRLTALGQESIQAFLEYQESLVPDLYEVRHELIQKELGIEIETEDGFKHVISLDSESSPIVSSSGKLIPAILRIMANIGDPLRFSVLLIVNRGTQKMAFRDLQHSLETELNREVAGSTLSNILSGLEQEGLVEREPPASFLISPLGEKAIEAYEDYQSKLIGELRKSLEQHIADDLAIKAPNDSERNDGK